jgi:peptidoglycan-N-acetylglucosamine deacetylase
MWMMKKKIILIITAIFLALLVLFGTYKLMNSRTYQFFGGITQQVETEDKVVALTFDDGPTENIPGLLPLLEKYNAKATFFLIGNEMEKFPGEAEKLVTAGHQIGNHTYSHKRMIFKSPSFIKQEVEKTDKLIRSAGYTGEIDFRPPNSKKLVGLPYYLNKHQRDTITMNLEPDTYYTSALDKVKYINENIQPGSIILLHPWYIGNAEEELKAVEGILEVLSKKGYKFVTVNELQQLANK